MGQKVNPIGMRLQVNRTWDSRWFAESKDYDAFAHGNDDIVSLIRSIYLETIRENGRKHAEAIRAA